jgi:hypothetical protein
MSDTFWFNRFIEYWNLPTADAVLDHVRRAQIQLVQTGNFGPDFYSMAAETEIERSWTGMPIYGIEENLALAAELIPQIQEAGARVVGQLSMTMHFGNHKENVGLFGEVWEQMWTDNLLGPAPCPSVATVVQLAPDGTPNPRFIEGRPHYTYRGCICNPEWLAVIKAMVTKGLKLGLDGFNTTHNYESFCHCTHCTAYVRRHLQEEGPFSDAELKTLYGTTLEETEYPQIAPENTSAELLQRFASMLNRAAVRRRKEAFDDVFITHGRGLRPDLIIAQWDHKYDLRVSDERNALPLGEWGRDESYIWYSQGPYKWGSSIDQDYIADMGLPSRFMHAAGEGRPFVINKYDYRRWRVWAGEAMAHGGAALAFHAGPPRPGQEDSTRIAPEDYYGPVIRYQRFMAEHEDLLHPATPWSHIALVYPHRAEMEADPTCLDVLKRVGEWLEDAHLFFDIILDEQLTERAANYQTLILAEVPRLTAAELELVERHVANGGTLILIGASGLLDLNGQAHTPTPLQDWRTPPSGDQIGSQTDVGDGHVFYLPDGPWQTEKVALRTLDAEMPVYSRLHNDPFGRTLVDQVLELGGGSALHTDAPWFVRVRAWLPERENALVVHWINYWQDEEAAMELPIPIGPIKVECQLPSGAAVDQVEWRYPEMAGPITLEHTIDNGRVHFSIPRLIVYGMSVIKLRG